MEINKQLFEDILSGKLTGKFVLRSGDTCFSADLHRNYNKFRLTHLYMIGFGSYTPEGIFSIDGTTSNFDIIDFIPDTNMKENKLTIEIPNDKVIDWDESKKQNKIVLKDKQLTYGDVCDRLPGMIDIPLFDTPSKDGNALVANEPQFECILAKNKLANVAVYLNDGWKPTDTNGYSGYFIFRDGLNKNFCTMLCDSYMYNNNVCFKNPKLARQAIEILGEETVKLALEPLGI